MRKKDSRLICEHRRAQQRQKKNSHKNYPQTILTPPRPAGHLLPWQGTKDHKRRTTKATFPDIITPVILKHSGPTGINYITAIINLSLSCAQIPNIRKIWKAKSYHPISLLSLVATFDEKLIHPLHVHTLGLKTTNPASAMANNLTALHTITNDIQQGLNRRRHNHRSVMV